jgi:L-rhamnose isomerase/sugar isomerase
MIVARLIAAGRLGVFHFNGSEYSDDDLDAGPIEPYRLFLVFNELVDAELPGVPGFAPAHMLEQRHNVTDPIESLTVSATEMLRAYARALLVDRAALDGFQQATDAVMASATLKVAFRILARARLEAGAAIDPVAAYRASGYRARVTGDRPAVAGAGGGIV